MNAAKAHEQRFLGSILQFTQHSHAFITWLADHYPSPYNPVTQDRLQQLQLMHFYNKYMEYRAEQWGEIAKYKDRLEKALLEEKENKQGKGQQDMMLHLDRKRRQEIDERIAALMKKLADLQSVWDTFIKEQTQKIVELYSNHVYTGPQERNINFRDANGNAISVTVNLQELHDYVQDKMLTKDATGISTLEHCLKENDPLAAIQREETNAVVEYVKEVVLQPLLDAGEIVINTAESVIASAVDKTAAFLDGVVEASSSAIAGMAKEVSAITEEVQARVANVIAAKDENEMAVGINDTLKNDDDLSLLGDDVGISNIEKNVKEMEVCQNNNVSNRNISPPEDRSEIALAK